MRQRCSLIDDQWILGAAVSISISFFLCSPPTAGAQTLVDADGSGNTYELLSKTLGGIPYEVPDCSDPSFGRHIREAWDPQLRKFVFVFYLHLRQDTDRCINSDRQRTEIKSGYPAAPDALKAFAGDTMTWRWRFKLDAGFRTSRSWSVIHSHKAGDGAGVAGDPIMQFDAINQGPGSQIWLQYVDRNDHWFTLSATSLRPFLGVWVEAIERASFPNGPYSVHFRRVSDKVNLWSYSNPNLDMWRDDNTFVYSKWGLYRGLGANAMVTLRDEQIRYSGFCIAKAPAVCPVEAGRSQTLP